MKTTIIKVWTDAEAVYIRTNTGEVYGERFADYPSLAKAAPAQLARFKSDNIGIQWEDLDEDLSYRGMMTENKRCREIN